MCAYAPLRSIDVLMQLVASPGWRIVVEGFDVEIARLLEQLVGCPPEGVRQLQGRILALRAARDKPKALITEIRRSEQGATDG